MAPNGAAAEMFEAHRAHLRAVAFRMLGSEAEADDVVQEAWLRFSGSDTGAVDNLGGWLTTVVSRLCLDQLRSRKARREQPLVTDAPEVEIAGVDPLRPDRELALADSVGVALLVVLERLAPVERVAFVLHDMFELPFEEIAPIVERSPAATRQLASRARRRVQGLPDVDTVDPEQQRNLVDAFLAASRNGDITALLAVLAPDVVLRADAVAIRMAATRVAAGAPALVPELRGARAVVDTFAGRARAAQPAIIDGWAGAAWAQQGIPRAVFAFTATADDAGEVKISAVEIIMEPERIRGLQVALLPGVAEGG